MTTTQQAGQLNDLIPDIYPTIAEHLPLHATPSTLLALALTNHHISEIVLPLVYSRLILKSEGDAIHVLQKLLADPSLGRMVRELHVMSDLSLASRNGENPFDVIKGVQQVIEKGLLPFIHTLGLRIGSSWHYDSDFNSVNGFGYLTPEFWTAIRDNSPRFKALVLNGFGDNIHEPWLDDSGTLEVPNITSLNVHFRPFAISDNGCEKLVNHISTLSSSLHTLGLAPNSQSWTDVTPILALNLPLLRSLSLSSFDKINTPDAMAFWERHPALQYIDLSKNDSDLSWFAPELPPNFLPNLRHLRASFKDIRWLAPILPQLLSLSILDSVNAQIPYLLRSVIPDGLPNLKSLDIGQASSRSSKNVNVEGALWYEDAEGAFHEVPVKKQGTRGEIFENYVHSIARAVPNLEELAFSGLRKDQLEKLVEIADEFAAFKQLERFYFNGGDTIFSSIEEDDKNALLSQAKLFAAAVPSLVSITDANILGLPYATVRIQRDDSGGVVGAEFGKGYGLQIGHDDEAFPALPVP